MHLSHNKQQTDFYKIVASELFNIPYEEVTKEQRALAKSKFLLLSYYSENKEQIDSSIKLTEQ